MKNDIYPIITLKTTFLTSQLNLDSLILPNIFTLKFLNQTMDPYKLSNGIQETLFMNSKEFNSYKNDILFFKPNRTTLKTFSCIKDYTPKGDLLINSSSFSTYFSKIFVNEYKDQKHQHNARFLKKTCFLLKKRGIIVGITNFNYIVNVNGIICNIKNNKRYNIYDTIDVIFFNWGLKKKVRMKKFRPYWKKDSFFFKKSKIKNFYFTCSFPNKLKQKAFNSTNIMFSNKSFSSCVNKQRVLLELVKKTKSQALNT